MSRTFYEVVNNDFNRIHYPGIIGNIYPEPPPYANVELTRTRPCPCGSHQPSWWEKDARGIELARVCEVCKDEKMARYRPDVLTDPNYWHDEPIDAD
jgi:hypothetical protein